MNFINELESNITNKFMNKLKELEMNVNIEKGAIKSNSSSPKMVSVKKKAPLRALPVVYSIGKNIEYNFKSLKDNPAISKTITNDDFIKEFENHAKSMGIKNIGYTKVSPDLIFQDKAILYGNAIVLTKEIDKRAVDNDLSGKTVTDLKLYNEFGKKINKLADYLRENGFGAHASHPSMGLVTYPSLAQNAGLGWIGKSNLLITPELGPRQKISAIFTSIENLPYNETNKHSWIADYCNTCGKCIKKCPENAIIETGPSNGPKRTILIPEICKGCNESCTICMGECPFNKREYESLKNRFEKINGE